MKIGSVSALCLVFASLLANASERENIDNTKTALDEIVTFAVGICNEYSDEGSRETLRLEGDAAAKLDGLAKKIANLGFEGAVTYEQTEYKGALRGDITELLLQSARCKQEIATLLIERLVTEKNNSQSNLPTGFTTDDKGFIIDRNGQRICRHRMETTREDGYTDQSGNRIGSSSMSIRITECQLFNGAWIETR